MPVGSGVDFLCGFQLEWCHIHGLHICQNTTSFPVYHQIPSTVMQGFCLLAEDPLQGVCRFLGGRLWGGKFELLTLGACGVWVYVTLPSVYILLRPDNVGEVLSYTPSMLITLNPRKTQRISVRGLWGLRRTLLPLLGNTYWIIIEWWSGYQEDERRLGI